MTHLAPIHPTHATEPTPIHDAALMENARQWVIDMAAERSARRPFAARVCARCNATGTEPCRTASGKALRRYHVARG